MRFLFTIFVALNMVSTYAQLKTWNNFFSLTNFAPNEFDEIFENFPALIDTTSADSSKVKSNASGNLFFSFNVAISNQLLIGLKLHHVGSKESSFGLFSYGPVFRVYPHIKALKSPFQFVKTNEIANNFFFVELSSLYGKFRYSEFKLPYSETFLMVGASIRAPLDQYRFIRHFGVELSAGLQYRTQFEKVNGSNFMPYIHGGLNIYLDKKYLKIN